MIDGPFRPRPSHVARRLLAVGWALLLLVVLCAVFMGCDVNAGREAGLSAVALVVIVAVLAVVTNDAHPGDT